MRVIIQRTTNSSVKINGKVNGEINSGLTLLVGITHDDTINDVTYCANKIANMRIFEDENEKMNLSIKDVNGKVLSISQFTLYANCSKGNRPSFVEAAKPDIANKLYEDFNALLRVEHNLDVQTGQFGADMQVSILNDGPVTIILDSKTK